jgi:hypothetical protein
MIHYRLYLLDVAGHITSGRDIHYANDAEAVAAVRDHKRDHGMELWQGPRRVETFPKVFAVPPVAREIVTHAPA